MLRASLAPPRPDAQWTGIATRIGERLLETGAVDAVLTVAPETIAYLEFRPDYHVELRFADGRKKRIPFLQLPISKLPPDFFPMTCRTCVDYTNSLADITVGYMGGQGEQWLLVRNARGEELLATLGGELKPPRPAAPGSAPARLRSFSSIPSAPRAACRCAGCPALFGGLSAG
jgi:coenzyme F420-reducing hydrogenase beta subunit